MSYPHTQPSYSQQQQGQERQKIVTNGIPGPGETKLTYLKPTKTPPTVYRPIKTDEMIFEKQGMRIKIINFKIGIFDGALLRFEYIDQNIISPELANVIARLVSGGYRLVVVETDDPHLASLLVTTLITVTTSIAVKKPGEKTAQIVFSVFNFPAGARIEIDF